MAGLIEQYLAILRRDLDFDPRLSRRLASEVEAHLKEAAEADPAWPSPEAEKRAIAKFGTPREITTVFTTAAFARQVRRTWLTVMITILVTFVAMRLRVVWLDGRGEPITALAPFIDRYFFLFAIGTGVIGWFKFRQSPIAPAFCLAGLTTSIVAGMERAGSLAENAPTHVLLTAAFELALLGLLSFRIASLYRRQRAVKRRMEG